MKKNIIKTIEIESFYKHQNSKKKLQVYYLIDKTLVGIRIMNGKKCEGSIVLDMDKLRKALK